MDGKMRHDLPQIIKYFIEFNSEQYRRKYLTDTKASWKDGAVSMWEFLSANQHLVKENEDPPLPPAA